ncbi:MAG TPA: hypothetical protein VG754_14205 [Verrucomicrobiae bacterium]|nr:hypothetical protein [Verrucomicrobiae bacterium]
MIDFAKIRQQPTGRTVFKQLIANALDLFLMLYGLKCILFQHGKMLLAVRGRVHTSLHLAPMSGTLAAIVGLQYAAFGLFIFLWDGSPPPENRGWLWRIGRGLLRWGSLALALWCFFEMPDHDPEFLFQYNILWLIVFIAGFFGLQSFLIAMYAREQVKRELNAMQCRPMHILWRPLPYWLSPFWFLPPTGFRVIYCDPSGSIHKGYCYVYRSFRENPQWGNRRVRWLTDTVTRELPSTEVYVDSEIIRPKLKKWDASTEADNLLENPDEPSD